MRRRRPNRGKDLPHRLQEPDVREDSRDRAAPLCTRFAVVEPRAALLCERFAVVEPLAALLCVRFAVVEPRAAPPCVRFAVVEPLAALLCVRFARRRTSCSAALREVWRRRTSCSAPLREVWRRRTSCSDALREVCRRRTSCSAALREVCRRRTSCSDALREVCRRRTSCSAAVREVCRRRTSCSDALREVCRRRTSCSARRASCSGPGPLPRVNPPGATRPGERRPCRPWSTIGIGRRSRARPGRAPARPGWPAGSTPRTATSRRPVSTAIRTTPWSPLRSGDHARLPGDPPLLHDEAALQPDRTRSTPQRELTGRPEGRKGGRAEGRKGMRSNTFRPSALPVRSLGASSVRRNRGLHGPPREGSRKSPAGEVGRQAGRPGVLRPARPRTPRPTKRQLPVVSGR